MLMRGPFGERYGIKAELFSPARSTSVNCLMSKLCFLPEAVIECLKMLSADVSVAALLPLAEGC